MSSLALHINCAGGNGFRLSVDCEVPAHGVTAVHGPSGSGKSTLLDCVAGLRKPEPHSVVRLGDTAWQEHGHNTPPWKRGIAYVFQDARLFPHLNVLQNLQYGMKRQSSCTADKLDDIVHLLQLMELLSQETDRLSAGQKQRVAIGRALLSNPRLMLLDEPLANLDQAARQQCLQCLQQLGQELRLPMLYVSHDIEEVSQIADHLVLLDEGQITNQGSMLDLCSRLDTRLSHEEQAAAIVSATIAGHDEQYGLTRMDVAGQPLLVNHLPQAPGQTRRVRIPARDVSICRQRPTDSSILNILPVTISEIEDSDAPRLLLRLSLGSQYLLARITRKSTTELGLRVGDNVFAQIKSAALLMETADPT
jgi:molybdate transport system ATP-binding protein